MCTCLRLLQHSAVTSFRCHLSTSEVIWRGCQPHLWCPVWPSLSYYTFALLQLVNPCILIILSVLSSGLCQLVYKRLSVNMLLSCLGVCHVCCVSRLCILLLLLYLMPFLSPLLRIIAFTSLTLCSLCYNSMLSLNALLLPFFPSAPLMSTYLR